MENKMTPKEVINEYGEVNLSFSSYYKYSFTFSGTAKDGAKIVGSFGGDSDDIYRLEVSASDEIRVKDFQSQLNFMQITKDDEVIFEHYDYGM